MHNERGSYTIETLLIFPVTLVVFFLSLWGGVLMYTWSSVNYVAMTFALDAAKEGAVTNEILAAVTERVQQLPLKDKSVGVEIATAPQERPDRIVVWGPRVGEFYNRGEPIQVGIVYPVKVPSPLLRFVGNAVFGGDTIYLKAQATARSEVYRE